jgi:L-threonylcarbamoyladenylate synthase
MIVIRIKKNDPLVLRDVAGKIKAGGIIVYPTDTAYAIGCDATNVLSVHKIFEIKGRPKTKAMPIVVADLAMAKKFFVLGTHNSKLATKYWPAPLSIVVKAKKGIAASALFKGTAAIRVPDSKISRTLAKFIGRPLIATSANISGEPLCYSVKAFLRQIDVFARSETTKQSKGDRRVASLLAMTDIDIILDWGALPRRKPSTIIKVVKNGSTTILRKGSIGLDIRH